MVDVFIEERCYQMDILMEKILFAEFTIGITDMIRELVNIIMKNVLHKFSTWIDKENDAVYVDENEIKEWEKDNPQTYNRDSYLGLYADLEWCC